MTTAHSMVSWIAATQSAVDLAKDQKEATRQIGELEDVRTGLVGLIGDFRELVDGASFARGFGWEGWAPSQAIEQDFDRAVKDLDPRPLNRLVADLGRASRDIRSALIAAWGEHARRRLGDVEELLILAETLSEVEGVADLSRRLQRALLDLAGTQQAIPSVRSVASLKNAEALLAELEESLQPAEVRNFLSSVAHGGAPMDLLTEDVAAWLRSHDALGSFKIVARSPMETTSD